MAWFRNHYVCIACQGHWIAEHAEAIEQDCLFCRAYDVAPYKSDDWSGIVEPLGKAKPRRKAIVATVRLARAG
jgi:hypothetical protein